MNQHRSLFIGFAVRLAVCVMASGVVFGQKPQPKYPVLALALRVETQDSMGNVTKVVGDATGNVYSSGTDGVCITFDQYGNLIMNFDCANSTVQRNLVFISDEPLQAQAISTPLGSAPPLRSDLVSLPPYWSYVSTVPATDLPGQGAYVPLQQMGIGSTQCIQVNMSYTYSDRKGTEFRLAYHRTSNNPPYTEIPSTPYGVMTRTDSTTWTLEPDLNATCNQPPKITSFGGTAGAPDILTTPTKGSFQFQDAGTWVMPFKFILMAQ